MSETNQTQATPDHTNPEAPASPTLNMQDMLRMMNESSRSIFDENSVFRNAVFDTPSRRTFTTLRPDISLRTPTRQEEYYRSILDLNNATSSVPPLERITVTRPRPEDVVPPGTFGTFTLNSEGLSITGSNGGQIFTETPNPIGNIYSEDPFTLGSPWGQITDKKSSSDFGRDIIHFLKENLTLNVSMSRLAAGLEVKVSLNLIETNEEILSAEDFVELD